MNTEPVISGFVAGAVTRLVWTWDTAEPSALEYTQLLHFFNGRLWFPFTLRFSSCCNSTSVDFLDVQVLFPQWKQSLVPVLFLLCYFHYFKLFQRNTYLFFDACCLTLLSHSPSHIFSPPPCVALVDALMDTDTTPQIQLINRSNFATDAIFLSFPPAGWAPLIQLADPPRIQTLLCSPRSLTNHLPPCLCDRAEPWRSLFGTCWHCLRVASPLDAATAGESAWPAHSS